MLFSAMFALKFAKSIRYGIGDRDLSSGTGNRGTGETTGDIPVDAVLCRYAPASDDRSSFVAGREALCSAPLRNSQAIENEDFFAHA